MSTFTDELRHENYEILQILNKAKRLSMRTLQGRRAIFDHKRKILEHLLKEDTSVHKLLQDSVTSHPDLKQSLDMFKRDIEGITGFVKNFFIKYDATDSSKELNDDFDILFSKIIHRIEKEENIFYEEFDELEKEEELLKNMLL